MSSTTPSGCVLDPELEPRWSRQDLRRERVRRDHDHVLRAREHRVDLAPRLRDRLAHLQRDVARDLLTAFLEKYRSADATWRTRSSSGTPRHASFAATARSTFREISVPRRSACRRRRPRCRGSTRRGSTLSRVAAGAVERVAGRVRDHLPGELSREHHPQGARALSHLRVDRHRLRQQRLEIPDAVASSGSVSTMCLPVDSRTGSVETVGQFPLTK